MPTHLVIVESPTKAKTIKRFLGKEYAVHASMGHVRDLPKSTLGVDTDADFHPTYEIPPEKKSAVKKLKDAFKEADSLWIATDEDREGEAIGWHLVEVLKPQKEKEVKRIVFHEITEGAIRDAIQNPRTIDMHLVDAQQARRVLDRLVGYTLSPFLWKKVYRGLSAGRVQSVAVRILVDREREVQAFKPQEYWTIAADLLNAGQEQFTAELKAKNGKKFVPANQEEAAAVVRDLENAPYEVADVEEKEVRKSPPPPFTTSTLQQEASRKLGFSVKQTMLVAQQLYEGISLGKGEGAMGLITYMRTDSVSLSSKALEDAKRTVEKLYGREYILSEPRKYQTKSKGAQEAHEAIRPTEIERTPESLKDVLDTQQLKLYTLIWNRTIATQMPPAELKRVGADISAGAYTFRATGQTVTFDGYYRVYSEGTDESEDNFRKEGSDEGEKHLPPLKKGEALTCNELQSQQHFTKPPPRYTEASLVKKLEEEGIGRPSTYAPTISTIQQRGYIRKEGKQLIPEDIAFRVTDLLTEHFSDIVDIQFTAKMEQSLDDIAEGTLKSGAFLERFYEPFHMLVESKTKTLSKAEVMKERILGTDPKTGLEVIAKSGRFGPYVQLGREEDLKKGAKPRSASLAKGKTTEDVTLEEALGLLIFPKEIGELNGETVIVTIGRFGPYLKIGEKNVSVPKDKSPASVTLEDAVQYMEDMKEQKKKQAEPIKVLGKDPTSGGEIQVKDGRYGPYVTDGKTNASLPKRILPEDVDLVLAAQLLDKKRNAPPRKWKRKQ
ncbi:MAG: type I DNA topoisomerase [Candidatus Peribacteraceae bacterium]|nr:type I DNA topoisomerase [Candidatus Peribacteraceae bacterium]